MQTKREDHTEFWRTLAAALKEGDPLARCLDRAGAHLAGTAWEEICAQSARRLEGGATLSQALQDHPDVFDARIVSAVTAGEEGGVLDVQADRIAAALAADDLGSLESPQPGEQVDAAAAEAGEYLVRVVRTAVERRASDIHFEPCGPEGGRVRLRVDGVLHELERVPGETYAAVVARLKVMCTLDPAERGQCRDGRFDMTLDGERYDLRLSVIPVVGGERVVCRLLIRQKIMLGLDRLGLGEADVESVRRFCGLPCGMVVVNGPTGCGKTTLLYSMLMEMNREACCVLTVEDPVEVTFEGVSQMQIRPAVGMTFARAIRSMLRQDPDVILVGELRDLEMMNLCVQVALTGHLLLTTLHASTSAGAIRRLIDCGVAPFLINSTLQGVISPRLVRMLCENCRRPAPPPPEHSLPPEAAEILASLPNATFYESVGCEACHGTGYRGRTAIYEILTMDDRVRGTVSRPVDMAALTHAARAAGMKPMLADGLAKAARGITSIREVVRVVPLGTQA